MKTAIEFEAWDAACLPELLRKEIEAVERSIARRQPGERTDFEQKLLVTYLGQLRGCQAAVAAVRSAR